MRLETKLGISTGVVIAAMLGSVFVAHLRIRQANNLYQKEATGRTPIITLARDIRFAAVSVHALQSWMLFEGEPGAERFHNDRISFIATGNAAFASLLDPSRQLDANQAASIRHLQTSVAQLDQLEDEAERLKTQHTPDASRQAYALVHERILPLDKEIFTFLNDFLRSQEGERDREIADLQRTTGSVLPTLWTATLLSAVFGGLISVMVARRITGRIQLLAERANAIAAGDLTGAPLPIHSSDQIGSLAVAMQQMQGSLASIIGTMAETATSIASSAISMRSASDQVHRRVDEQTQQTQGTATAMQMMSASIAEVSRHTQSAVESARSAALTAREGGGIVQGVLDSMRSVRSAFSDTSATMGVLGEDSRRISQIVTVITEIARKTNLLALNAAIEAARAGEQGRGFAVVAGEVRHLAESTAQATSEIAAMIQAVQTRTGTAIASLSAGTATVEQGVDTTSQAGQALERIIGMAERVERMITQIAIAAGQQASAADQSTYALDSIHTLSTENLAELATASARIEALHRTAATLECQVERFRLTTFPRAEGLAAATLSPSIAGLHLEPALARS